MNNTYTATEGSYETLPMKTLVSWRSVFAGLIISLMTLAALLALGVAFGGIGLTDGSTIQDASIFAGVTVVVATAIAGFLGSYFAVRLSRFKVDVVGCAQGLVVGSMLILLVLWQTMSTVSTLGKAAAQATGAAAVAAGSTAGAAAQNPMVRDLIEDSLGGTTLKSDPETVVRGVSARLLRGDREGAKNYLAIQAGMTPAAADVRINELKGRVDALMVQAREASATAMRASGWSIFVLVVLTGIASILGGLIGSQINLRGTLDSRNEIMTPKRTTKTFDKPARS